MAFFAITTRRRAKVAGAVLLFLFLAGLLYGFLYGGFPPVLSHGRASGWPWWYYLLAVPVVGALGLLVEGVASAILAPFFWRGEEHPPWRRAMFVLFVVLAICLALALALSPLWLAKLGVSNAI